eukprot:5014083-Pyramimonas_sp.AAC.1
MARSSLSMLSVFTMLALPAALEKWRVSCSAQPTRDGEFRSSQPIRGGEVSSKSALGTHYAGPLTNFRKWRQVRRSNTFGDGE